MRNWTDESKLLILQKAREELIEFAYWGHAHHSVSCLDAIIKDYKTAVKCGEEK